MSTELQLAKSPKELLDFLTKGRGSIEMALPKHLNADRMMRLALTSFSTTPGIRNCTPRSILSSLVVATQLGLEPGIAGQGYLIPYGNTCTFIPGWQGLVGLLNNSERATAWTGSVFEGDVFDFELGSSPRCRHIPGENYGDDSKLIWVYACGKVNGSPQPVIEAWPMSRIKKHRDKYNKVGMKHYSYNNMEMYARKVVLLQVLKYMPKSIELNNAIAAADAAIIGKEVKVDNGIVVEVDEIPVKKTERSDDGDLGPAGNLSPKTEDGSVIVGDVVKLIVLGCDTAGVTKAEMDAYLKNQGMLPLANLTLNGAQSVLSNLNNVIRAILDLRKPEPEVKAAGGMNYKKAIKGLLSIEKLDEDALIIVTRGMGITEETLSSLDDIDSQQPKALKAIYDGWKAILVKVKEASQPKSGELI